MKLSVCTISFRHHLISIEELARWAQAHAFDGVELWGAHAKNLWSEPHYDEAWLGSCFGLRVSMLSDYLPLDGPIDALWAKLDRLCELASRWGTHKLRTFAGSTSTAATTSADRRRIVERLRAACERAQAQGMNLLVETHPHTLADSTEATLRLLAEVNHPALRINFDVLHLWEAGDEPAHALTRLRNHVSHFHLKNIGSREFLGVFAPANVYSAAGTRSGMVPLFEGAFDYAGFLAELACDEQLEASLEWFGDDVRRTLDHDRRALAILGRRHRSPPKSGLLRVSGADATRLAPPSSARRRSSSA